MAASSNSVLVTLSAQLLVSKSKVMAMIPTPVNDCIGAVWDLYSAESTVINPWDRAVCPIGLNFWVPKGQNLIILPNYLLALERGVQAMPMYVNPLDQCNGLLLFNQSASSVTINQGSKIAQLMMFANANADSGIVEVFSSFTSGSNL